MINDRVNINFSVPEFYEQTFTAFKEDLINLNFTGARLNGLLERAARILKYVEENYADSYYIQLGYFASRETFQNYIGQPHLVDVSLSDHEQYDDVVYLVGDQLSPKQINTSINLNSSQVISIENVAGESVYSKVEARNIFELNIQQYNCEEANTNKLFLSEYPSKEDLIHIHESLVNWSSASMMKFASSPNFFSLQLACVNQIDSLGKALKCLLSEDQV